MNLLLSIAGDKTDMIQYFKYAVGNTGKVFASDCSLKYSLTQADGYLITPQAYDDSYITVLSDYCNKNNITAIIPLSDADLFVLSKNKNKLCDLGISVIVSDESVVDICIDRWKTYLFLESIGVKQPKSYIDVEAAKRDIESGTLAFPLFLSPRLYSEKENVIDVYNFEEFDLFYRKMEQKLSNASDLYKDKAIVIQEEIYGDKYGLCIFNDLQGNFVSASSLHKISATRDETMIASVDKIKPFEHIIELFSSELKHVACLEIDCCLQEAGDVIISEIHTRFGKNYPFWHVAGANFPKQIVDWINGFPTSQDNLNTLIGVKGCREKLLPFHFDF